MTAIPLTPAPSYRSTDSLPRRPSDARPSSTSISPINHTSTPRSSSSSSSSPSPTTPSSPIRPISTSSSTSPTDTSGLGSPISAPGGKKDKSRIDLLYAIQDYALKHLYVHVRHLHPSWQEIDWACVHEGFVADVIVPAQTTIRCLWERSYPLPSRVLGSLACK